MDVASVKSLVVQAKRAAQKRGQEPSTAHLLLAILQRGGEASSVLSSNGVKEASLLGVLREKDAETSSALDRALERSIQLATNLGHQEADPLHLLWAITRDERSAAHRTIMATGAPIDSLRRDVLSRLGQAAESIPDEPRSRNEVVTPWTSPSQGESVLPASLTRSIVAKREITQPRPERQQRGVTSVGTSRVAPPANRRRRQARPIARRDPEKVLPPVPESVSLAFARALVPVGDDVIGLAEPVARRAGNLTLEKDRFPLLVGLGRNLSELAATTGFDPLIGRERELEMLCDILARRRSNNPILIGPPGVGKTAIIEGLAAKLARGESGVAGFESRVIVELSAGALLQGTSVRGALSEKLKKLRAEVAAHGDVIVFVDEIHAMLSGEAGEELAQELKSALSRGEFPCIGATTPAEYKKHFEKDAAFARRFFPIFVDEPSVEEAGEILRGLVPSYEAHHQVTYSADAILKSIEWSVRYLPDERLPDKAVSVLDLAAARSRRQGGVSVDEAAVALVVAERARMPVARLLSSDVERLLDLERILSQRIVGQDAALMTLAQRLRKSAAGLRGSKPIGTFLLLGPTGVGKTETAKAVSDSFFGVPMTRLDMSEYSEAHSIARLLGAPPGYIGHDDGGQLTEAVRKRPYQLVLLDEIEKAHPDVLLALLPLLDEGRLTDGKGRTVDFRNTVVVMTSNLGVAASTKRAVGFGSADASTSDVRDAVLEDARKRLPPELWNRIDEPLSFRSLERDDVAEIARRALVRLSDSVLKEHGVEVAFGDEVVEVLLSRGGFDRAYGARPLSRTIARLIEGKLAEQLLSAPRGSLAQLEVSVEGAEIVSKPIRRVALPVSDARQC